MALVTLLGYSPPQRFAPDNAMWEQARIQESADQAGTYSTIETINPLAPPVTDPADPPTYSFTTENAVIGADGWYRVVWIDENGFEQPTQPVKYEPLPDWAPALPEVAALLRARLKVHGQQHVTFDNATRPTAAQAAELVATATQYVASRAVAEVPAAHWLAARHLAVLRAVMLIELSFWPEQINDENSMFQSLKTLFDEELDALIDALADEGTGPDLRVGSIPVVSSTVGAYHDVYGVNLNETLP